MDAKQYLMDRKEEIKNIAVKKRLEKVKENVNFINAIIGPRRAGKSYFLYYLIKSKDLDDSDFAFVNFEEININPLKIPFLHNEIYGNFPKYLFFDEIQVAKDWVRSIYTLYEKKKYFIFLTGSNSKLLSKEIATQLRGRSIPVKIYPFSFLEIMEIEKLDFKDTLSSYKESKIKNMLYKLIQEGCFPDIVLRNISPSLFFSEYIDLVMYKDILERYDIRNRFALEMFIRSIISSHTKQFSVHKAYSTLKSQGIAIAKDTLYNFQKYIEDANFCFFLKKYNKSYRKMELSIPKVFLVDNGIYKYSEGKNDVGKMMEAFVFSELLKKGFEANKNLFYYQVNGEVDFVIKEGMKIKQLIQVTYASHRDEIEQREIKALQKASELLKCKDLLVITWDYESEEIISGKKIKFIPLWKWLLK